MKDVIEYSEKFIKDSLNYIGVKPSVVVTEEEGTCYIDIEGERLNFLIGYRGDSLEGLQHLLSLALFKEFGEWQDVSLDINGYRMSKKEKLEDMSKGYIDRVRFFSEEVSLPPMSAYERKIIHEFVSTYDDVDSYSEGEGRSRHIILKPIS